MNIIDDDLDTVPEPENHPVTWSKSFVESAEYIQSIVDDVFEHALHVNKRTNIHNLNILDVLSSYEIVMKCKRYLFLI